ncbi:hypothetical protein D0Z07_4527 [Hyphodiscus hymeniophilus]|uniref:Uncharacterized protein n=1 Tax=Hyphodiscus hymeniophilus TaxID=353542 RepID=A0A9P6VK38_9HELO|nr:hypothetical protein D0Z07_4527 [Hyphodiscus hymeniophilus]
MSRTQTVLEPTTILETLRVYDVHETGHVETSEAHSSLPQINGLEQPQSTAQSDPNWPSDWRRMPAYRESSRTHRVTDRAAGGDAVEGAIVVTVFHGVWLMGNLNRLWRATAGRWNDRLMRYEVGGEW